MQPLSSTYFESTEYFNGAHNILGKNSRPKPLKFKTGYIGIYFEKFQTYKEDSDFPKVLQFVRLFAIHSLLIHFRYKQNFFHKKYTCRQFKLCSTVMRSILVKFWSLVNSFKLSSQWPPFYGPLWHHGDLGKQWKQYRGSLGVKNYLLCLSFPNSQGACLLNETDK